MGPLPPPRRGIVDGRLAEVSSEDVRGDRGPRRCHLRQFVHGLVELPRNVVEFETVELIFKATYQFAVRLHFGVMTIRVLHDLVDDELRIAPYVETPHSKFDGDLQAVDKSFVLGCVVGGSEVELNHVTHMHSEGRDEEQTRTCPGLHQRPIKVHDPAFHLDLSRWQLGVGPLSHKID